MKTSYNPNNLLHGNITGDLLGAFKDLNYFLSSRQSLSEREMARALAIEMKNRSYHTALEVAVEHTYDGHTIGTGYADLIINDKVMVLVKKTRSISPSIIDQLRLFMEHTGLRVGVALTFGRPYAKLSQKAVLQLVYRRIELDSRP